MNQSATTTPAIRRASEDDLDRLAVFIGERNALSEHCCLMLPITVKDVRRDMAEFSEPAQNHIVLAEAGGRLVGAAACDWDREQGRGWVLGPFVHPHDPRLRARLFDELESIVPESVKLLDTYTDVSDTESYTFYLCRGFTEYKRARIYTAWRPTLPMGLPEPPRHLDPIHEAQFLELHAAAFPQAPDTGPKLLERQDSENQIFAVADGSKLAGYLAAHLSDAPEEGFVDYLAVVPEARGQRHGSRLLNTALHWFFEEMDMPQASLVVEDTNAAARHLYERAGFELRCAGVATRRNLREG
jgi:ribosomal protein S18 acetylase RimI-like enzyme